MKISKWSYEVQWSLDKLEKCVQLYSFMLQGCCRYGVYHLPLELFLWHSWSTTESSVWENQLSGSRAVTLTELPPWDCCSNGEWLHLLWYSPSIWAFATWQNDCNWFIRRNHTHELKNHCGKSLSRPWLLGRTNVIRSISENDDIIFAVFEVVAMVKVHWLKLRVAEMETPCPDLEFLSLGTGTGWWPHAEAGSCGISPSMETRSSSQPSSRFCHLEHQSSSHCFGHSWTQVGLC